jgi:hypothetical protein
MSKIPEAIALPMKGVKRGQDTFQVHDAQGAWVATTGDAPYASYIAHAMNEYPKLVEVLRRAPHFVYAPSNNGERWDEGHKAGFYAALQLVFELSQRTLRDLGED